MYICRRGVLTVRQVVDIYIYIYIYRGVVADSGVSVSVGVGVVGQYDIYR